jgi:hypothetical protein
MKIFRWIKENHVIWFVILAILFFLSRGLALDRYVTTDETPWIMRSGNFYLALGHREFIKTNQSIDPGVTLMIIDTAAFLLDAPQFRGFGEPYFGDYVSFDRFVESKNINPHQILITARELMLLENLILFLIAFGIAVRLVKIIPAVAGFALIALDPYHISLTMLSHLDGQLSCLMLLSILAFLGYLFDGQKPIYMVLSAGAASLGFLTKLPAYALIPFFIVLSLIGILHKWRNGAFKEREQTKKWVKHSIRDLLIWCGVFTVVYFLLWPAMWVDPITMIAKQIRAPFRFADAGSTDTNIAETGLAISTYVNSVLSFLNGFFRRFIYYSNTYLWQTTPIELIGVVIGLLALFLKITFFRTQLNRKISFSLLGFALLYVAMISISSKTSGRYIIPAFVLMDIIAAFGWLALLQLILSIRFRVMRYSAVALVVLNIFFIQIGGDVLVYPYFHSYYNPLLGGAKKAGETRFVGSGEGLDQAGRYLSQKPNAEDLTAMSWYGSGCFSYYFSGKTIIIPTGVGDNEYIAKNIVKADYLVVYTNQWFRRLPPQLFDILDHVEPEHTIWINDIEYVRIYKVDELPPEIYKW